MSMPTDGRELERTEEGLRIAISEVEGDGTTAITRAIVEYLGVTDRMIEELNRASMYLAMPEGDKAPRALALLLEASR